MQLNAFRLRSDAAELRKMLSAPLDKKVEMDVSGKYYTLETPEGYILDPTALEAIEGLMPAYGRLEMEDKWMERAMAIVAEEPVEREPVIIPKGSGKAWCDSKGNRGTTVARIRRKAGGEGTVNALQVAIFDRESQALKAQKRIMTKLNLPVEIVQQFDYYHVIVTGFYSREETFQYYPELAGIGYPRITLLENYKRKK